MSDQIREDGYYWVVLVGEPIDPFILYWRTIGNSTNNWYGNNSETCTNNNDYIVVSNKLECPLKAFL